mgnify:CR=1 FL=1
MKLPEPVYWRLELTAGEYIAMQKAYYEVDHEQKIKDGVLTPLYAEYQVKELLTQADEDLGHGMMVVHLQVADQMRRKYEPVLREVLDLLGPEAPECCGCRAEWEMAIAAIKKVLG